MLRQLVGLVQDPRFPAWRSALTAVLLEDSLAGKKYGQEHPDEADAPLGCPTPPR